MAKKKLTIEDVLVPKEEIPYEVPENWCWVKLGNIIQLISGRDIPGKLCNDEERGIPYILGASNIKDGIFTPERWIEEPVVIAEEGDILLSCKGTIGKTLILENEKIHISRQIMALRCTDIILTKYLKFYIDTYVNILIEKSKGLIPGITREDVISIEVPLPPLAEQERIVKRLESLFDKVDRAAGLVEEARDGFEKRRAAILERAFSGELTKKWREDNGVSYDSEKLLNTIKEERLSICQSKKETSDVMKMFEEDNFIDDKYPKGWLKLKSNMICHNITCGKTPTGNIIEQGEVPYLKVYNIVNNKIDFYYKPQFIDMETLESKLKSSILKPNDVIMNIVGPPLRKIAMIPDDYKYWGMNQAIVRFRTISKVLPKYLYYCLVNEDTLKGVINETRGVVGQANISVTQSRSLDIPVPSLKEQEEIVRILEKLLNNEEKIDELCDLVESVELVKKSILTKAFRGELGSNKLEEDCSINLLKKIIDNG